MTQQRKRHSARFKFDVAVEAAKGVETVNQLAAKYEIHPSQISQWKRQLLDEGTTVFSSARERTQREQQHCKPTYLSRLAASRWSLSG